MVNLKRFELDFNKTFAYVEEDLNETNTLSTELINLIDWKSGKFFAFLPNNVKKEDVYLFGYGDIASNGRIVRNFVLDELKKYNQLICVFDDFSDKYNLDYKNPLFQTCGLFHKKEIYFFVNQEIASPELIQKCFAVSDAIWHSLCVLSKVDLGNKKDKELTLSEIKNICLNATLIVIGAYDAEGYVMWESSENRHSSITELNDDELED